LSARVARVSLARIPPDRTEQGRVARGWLGWSQRQLAERAGVALNTVYEFEKGTTDASGLHHHGDAVGD
jgi:hypothetical protein